MFCPRFFVQRCGTVRCMYVSMLVLLHNMKVSSHAVVCVRIYSECHFQFRYKPKTLKSSVCRNINSHQLGERARARRAERARELGMKKAQTHSIRAAYYMVNCWIYGKTAHSKLSKTNIELMKHLESQNISRAKRYVVSVWEASYSVCAQSGATQSIEWENLKWKISILLCHLCDSDQSINSI